MKTCVLIIAFALAAVGCSKKDDAGKQAPAAKPATPTPPPAAAIDDGQAAAELPTAVDFEEGADQQVQEDNLEQVVEKLEAEVPE